MHLNVYISVTAEIVQLNAALNINFTAYKYRPNFSKNKCLLRLGEE